MQMSYYALLQTPLSSLSCLGETFSYKFLYIFLESYNNFYDYF